MAKILVTGGAGFIGSHVVSALCHRGEQVVVVDDFNDYYDQRLKRDRIKTFLSDCRFDLVEGDIRNNETLKKIFIEQGIKKICHLAARAGVRASLQEPLLYEEVNIRGTLNLLELARLYNVENFVFASSSSVYGDSQHVPFSENDPVDNPISPYAATKKATELLAHVYAHLYGLPVTALRFFTVYGPWGRPDMAYFKFANAIMAARPIDVYNEGKMKRDFTYVDDIVDGVISALDRPRAYDVINLGNNHPENLLDMINFLEQLLGVKAIKNFLPMQPGDVETTCADIEKAKRLLAFSPKINLQEGLGRFAAWHKNYYKK